VGEIDFPSDCELGNGLFQTCETEINLAACVCVRERERERERENRERSQRG
jgi:hypothetical protein